MTAAILTYEGYTLMERQQGGWRSVIDGETVNFDSAAQWVQYINLIKNRNNAKRNKAGYRH